MMILRRVPVKNAGSSSKPPSAGNRASGPNPDRRLRGRKPGGGDQHPALEQAPLCPVNGGLLRNPALGGIVDGAGHGKDAGRLDDPPPIMGTPYLIDSIKDVDFAEQLSKVSP